MNQPLDETAKTIIGLLQHDGRMSYADLARRTGISETGVRQRVQHLTETGTIQVVAVTDPMRLGFNREALIGVNVSGDVLAAADAISRIPAADYVVTTAGRFDVIVEVVCENDDDLLDVIDHQIRSIPGVQSTEAFVYLKLNKERYDFGTR